MPTPKVDEQREQIFEIRSRSDCRSVDADFVGQDGVQLAMAGPCERVAEKLNTTYPSGDWPKIRFKSI